MAPWRYRAFGLQLESWFALPGIPPLPDTGRADIALRLATPGEIARNFSGPNGLPLWETVLGDGCAFRVDAGRLGDHLFTYGDRARFHLSMPAGALLCDPADRDDPAWQRQLLDTVLLCTSHRRGFELLHASAVEHAGGVMAIAAGTGGGKTSLAAELVARGSNLFADDIVALGRHGKDVVAHPAPPVMNVPHEHSRLRALGVPLATFDDERETWIVVEAASREPAALSAIFLLDRRPAVETSIERLASNPLHLLPHSVGFKDQTRRHRSRFELFADVAAATPIFRIRAAAALPPAGLADALEQALGAVPEAGLGRARR